MQTDYDVGFAALGLMITLINASGALSQIPIGFMVDRFGATRILISGLLIKTFAISGENYRVFIDSNFFKKNLGVLCHIKFDNETSFK